MVFIVHGRFDNKYLGSEPEFKFQLETFDEAKQKFYDMINQGAGTIFLEHYDQWGNQTKCYNQGYKIIEEV